jgi:hypothetical protein
VVALAGNDGRVLAVVQKGSDLNDAVLESPAGQLRWRTVLTLRGSVDEDGLALFGPVAWLAFGSGMYTTSDHLHWTLRHPCPSSYNFVASASLTSATDGVVGCGAQGFTGHQLKRVYGSGNGARTFTLLGGPPAPGGLTEIAATSNFTVTVAASSAASWLYGSFDGGRHYATTVQLGDGGNGWRDLGFTTPEQGVVVNSGDFPGALWMTRDGGRHWAMVSFG